jgi:hypothetical protein
MIMATIPDRKSTIIRELTMENQWICSSPENGRGLFERGGPGGQERAGEGWWGGMA